MSPLNPGGGLSLEVLDAVPITEDETEYVIPDNLSEISFQATEEDINMRHEPGGDHFTIAEDTQLTFPAMTFAGTSLYFYGNVGGVLRIRTRPRVIW